MSRSCLATSGKRDRGRPGFTWAQWSMHCRLSMSRPSSDAISCSVRRLPGTIGATQAQPLTHPLPRRGEDKGEGEGILSDVETYFWDATLGEKNMLRNVQRLIGNRIHASDGELGTVAEFYFDDETWTIVIWLWTPAIGCPAARC